MSDQKQAPAQAETKDETRDENKIVAERREKLFKLREAGPVFPNDFRRAHAMGALAAEFGSFDKPALEEKKASATVAGRMVLKRVMGKASFATLQDGSGTSRSTLRTTSRASRHTRPSSTGTWAISSASRAPCSRPTRAS